MKARHLPCLLLPIFLVACSPKAEPTASATTGTDPKGGATTAGTPDSASMPSTAPTTGDPSAKPAPMATLADVPEALKNDAYHYYGLGNPKPMSMEISISDQPKDKYTGAQTITIKEIKDGKPIFSIDRTGQLAKLGSQEVSLTEEGIFNTMSSIAKIGPKDMELPAKLAPGVTWKSHAEIAQGSETVVNDSDLKVVGPDKVKTPAGEHDALLITSTGQSTIGGKKAKTTSKNWYVLDLGVVKSVLVNTYSDGKVQTITIQETK